MTWDPPQHIVFGHGAFGMSVSCPTDVFCVVVGTHGDIRGQMRTYDGARWSAASDIPGTRGAGPASCPTASFCAAVVSTGVEGEVTTAVSTFDGSTWSAPTPIDDPEHPVSISAISCVSSSFCVAVGGYGEALTYDGTRWTPPTKVGVADDMGFYRGLTAASCVGPDFCVAVDEAGNAYAFNGSEWSAPSNVNSSNALQGVSCVTRAFCMTVGHDAAVTFDGTRWGRPASIDAQKGLSAVSCVSTSFCVAVTGYNSALEFDGTGWTTPVIIGGDELRRLTTLSCASPSLCVTIDELSKAIVGRSVQTGGSGAPTISAPATATAGVLTTVSGTAPPGAEVALWGVTAPNGTMTRVNTPAAVADSSGAWSKTIRPLRNVTLQARVGSAGSATRFIAVSTAVHQSVAALSGCVVQVSGSVFEPKPGASVFIRALDAGGNTVSLGSGVVQRDGRFLLRRAQTCGQRLAVYTVISGDNVNRPGATTSQAITTRR